MAEQALARGDTAVAVAHVDTAGDHHNAKRYCREAATSRSDFAEMSPSDYIINQLEAAGSLR